jgi:hypothetical protein
MFHLFNKVYIASDKTINLNFDRVVISESCGVKMHEALDQVSYGELITYGKTLDSILNNSTFNNFIKTLLDKTQQSNKKVIIYVDDDNFLKFMSMWFKTIFANPTADSSWKIIDDYIKKEKILKNWRYSSTSTDSDIFLGITKDKFKSDFNTTEDNSNYEIRDSLGIEVLLASYLVNGKHKVYLKQAISNILLRSMQELVIEMKHTYIKNFNKPGFPKLPIDINYFKSSTLYTNQSIGRVSSVSNVDIANASNQDILMFKQIAKTILIEWDQFKESSEIVKRIDYIDYVRQELTDEQLSEILNNEKNALSNNRIYSSADEEKINVYFLDFILNSNIEELKPYILK